MTKRVKQVLCLVLAMAMIAAMGVTAMASEYVITINPTYEDETYSIYRVFDVTYSAGTGGQNLSYTIESTSDWYSIVQSTQGTYDSPFTLTPAAGSSTTYVVTLDTSVAGTTETAQRQYVTAWFKAITNLPTADYTATGTGSSVDVDVEAAGYYFVTTTTGALVSLTTASPKATVEDKNATPSVDKEIVENGTGSGTSTAAIGDEITYRSTITDFEAATKLQLVDELSEGLTFGEIVSVYVDDADVTGTGVYTITYQYDTNSKITGFTIDFDVTNSYISSATSSTKIVVTYTATINENAVTTVENDTYVNYGNSSKSTVDTTETYVYEFDIKKVDDSGNILSGAEFELLDDNGDPIYVVDITSSVTLGTDYTAYYRLATDEEIKDPTSSGATTTISAGYVTIFGLDAGTYTLRETKAPDGYNILTYDINVTISESGVMSYNYDGSTDYYNPVRVINTTGSALPSTGGIGTTIFYVVGALLMIGAAVVLITRRRMRNN